MEATDKQVAAYTWHIITAAHPYLGRRSSVENRMLLLVALNGVNDYWRGKRVPRVHVGHPEITKLTLTIDLTNPIVLAGRRPTRVKRPPIKRVRSRFEFIRIIKEETTA